MGNYRYRASVIVPVYNVEKYLSTCVNSLVHQTIDSSQMEIILINDGSSDNSLEICKEYSEIYNFIKVVDKENEGVSATRNLGIKMATGKYIFFVDSDDTISKNTLKDVSDFFDRHYDEVDIVAYYDKYFNNGIEEKPHMRYKFLTETGVYDLNAYPYALQLRLSMCVKNMFENNHLFDEKMGYQEDQAYCAWILKEKMKLGFVKEATYNYMKNEDGVVAQQTNPITMFEKTTQYFEKLFYDIKNVPQYYQALFFHDLQWKFATACLYPYHYDENEIKCAKERIRNLLKHVEPSVIFGHPNIDNYQKLYWMRMKEDNLMTPVLQNNYMGILYRGSLLYSRKNVEIILQRIRIEGNRIRFVGYFKSPFFSLCSDIAFFTVEDNHKKSLEVNVASASHYKSKEKTDNFFGFTYDCDIENNKILKFKVVIDGVEYDTSFWLSPMIAFSKAAGYSYIANHEIKIELINDEFIISKISNTECNELIDGNTEKKGFSDVYHLRKYYLKNRTRNIWLYCDNYSVTYDNGWLQFRNDFEKADGIERYYIVTNDQWKSCELFEEKYHSSMIEFGSMEHKKLFLCASKLLTAFIEKEVCYPFNDKEISLLSDILNIEFVYLQHGILHAHLPWYYSPFSISVDKEVVSSNFELENLTKNYGFNIKDLIATGMPRYDYIDKTKLSKRQILFAPSWRSYLTGNIVSGGTIREGNTDLLQKSNYFKNIQAFINNEELIKVLEENDVELHLKLHPEFYCTYSDVSWVDSNRVKLAKNKVDLADYAAFITDFSSFVFDYAVFSRPIMYFVPDYIEFKAGLNRYRELDLPFEDAFGKLAITPEDAVQNLIDIISNNFIAEETYKSRMDSFYLENINCCEGIYNYLID